MNNYDFIATLVLMGFTFKTTDEHAQKLENDKMHLFIIRASYSENMSTDTILMSIRRKKAKDAYKVFKDYDEAFSLVQNEMDPPMHIQNTTD